MTEFSDWEIHSSNSEDLTTAFDILGFREGDGFTETGVRFSIDVYGTKYIRSITETFVDVFGKTQFADVAQSGVYAILRWFSSTPFPPDGVTVPPQVTIIPLPNNSPYVFE